FVLTSIIDLSLPCRSLLAVKGSKTPVFPASICEAQKESCGKLGVIRFYKATNNHGLKGSISIKSTIEIEFNLILDGGQVISPVNLCIKSLEKQ
ncbi:hypothetical protein ACJX0J_028721, partial [Zea mays]